MTTDELMPLSHNPIAVAAAEEGVTLRQIRTWLFPGIRPRGGVPVRCRGEFRGGEWYTSPAAIREFLELTRDIRRPAPKRDADGRREA